MGLIHIIAFFIRVCYKFCAYCILICLYCVGFWATICKTVHPMAWYPSVVCPLCPVQPSRLCVRWGPSPLLPKRGGAPSPFFGPFLLWPSGSMHQDATWYGCWPQPRGLCVRWRPSLPSPTKGAEPPPNFCPISIVPKRLDASRCHSVWR